MRLRPSSMLVWFAVFAGRAAAQDPGVEIPASVWATCPADDLPHHLMGLSSGAAGVHRETAVQALAAMGPRAHRWLLGGMRLPPGAGLLGVAPAFGGFGPASAWAMPALLEAVAQRGDGTALALLERLGSAAKPAAALLGRYPWPEHRLLAERLDALPDAVPSCEPMPAVVPVDPALREALLAVLRDPAQVARWWPALQALLGIDAEATIAAAEVLVLHAAAPAADCATRARELLLALRCYCAADALRSLDAVLSLPAPHRERELRRALLASCPPLCHARSSSRTDAQRVLAFAASASAPERRLAALSAAIHSVLTQSRELHRHDALAPLLADRDATTRALALVAARSSDALVEEFLAVSPQARFPWIDFADLDPEYLRRVPRTRLEQALEVLAGAGSARPRKDTGTVADQLLRATERPQPDPGDARALLAAVAAKAPELLLPFTDGDEPTRRALAQELARSASIPPAMCEWWLDQQDPKLDDRSIGEHLPLSTAPALLGRLRRGERLEHTLALLHTTYRYVDWHEVMDREGDAFAASAPLVPASHLQAFANLLTTGAQRRRVAQQLVLAADTTAALRTVLLRGLGGGNEQYPPSAEFVLACLKSTDPELGKHAIWIAGRATGSRDAVVALLLERLPGADEKTRRGIVRSLGQLGSPAAHAPLREQLRTGSAVLQRDAAIALASAAEPDAEGMAWLRAGIASDDAEHRRLVWRWISFSEEVAPLFLDEALERLVVGGDAQSTQRLRSLLGTVAKTRREEVLRAVARLTRHEEEEVSRMAEDLLNQLSAK